MNRANLKAAPWNPRQIDDEAKKKLRSSLKRVGLVSPIVWNKRTGTIVSGHQRLDLLDQLEGRRDYELDVAVIDVAEKTEKEINIFLNNELASGTWDINKLDSLMKDGLDFGNCGFEKFELQVLLPSFAAPMSEGLREASDAVGQLVGEVTEDVLKKRAMRKQIREGMQARDAIKQPEIQDPEMYVVLCFRNRGETEKFLALMSLPTSDKYISGEVVQNLVVRGLASPVDGQRKRGKRGKVSSEGLAKPD